MSKYVSAIPKINHSSEENIIHFTSFICMKSSDSKNAFGSQEKGETSIQSLDTNGSPRNSTHMYLCFEFFNNVSIICNSAEKHMFL